MDFSRDLLFFFSALGAFNGLAMGLYFLFYAKPKHISNRFLGALFIILSVRVGKSVFFYFNSDLASIYLQLGLSVCVFIGPFLYFYLASVFAPEVEIDKKWKLHALTLLSVMLFIGYLYPFKTNATLWREVIIKGIYLVWFLYTAVSAWILREQIRKNFLRNVRLKHLEVWANSLLFGNSIILAAYALFSYTYYIVGALSFTFIIYLLLLLLFFNKKKSSILFKTYHSDKYHLSNLETQRLIDLLDRKMRNEKLFRDADLKLPDLARAIQTSTHQLSQILNDKLGKSFNQYVNEFRIEQAKELIVQDSHLTIEAIGYDCGFNSKTTFFSAFKRNTGLTPSSFRSRY